MSSASSALAGFFNVRRIPSRALGREGLEQVVEQVVHDGLRDVGDDREGPLHVAADRRVADRLLAHVAGLEEEPRRRVRPGPHPLGAEARLDVLARGRGEALARLEHFLRFDELALEGVVDRDDVDDGIEVERCSLRRGAGLDRRVAAREREGAEHRARLGAAILFAQRGVAALDVPARDDEAEEAVAPPESATPMVLKAPVFSK